MPNVYFKKQLLLITLINIIYIKYATPGLPNEFVHGLEAKAIALIHIPFVPEQLDKKKPFISQQVNKTPIQFLKPFIDNFNLSISEYALALIYIDRIMNTNANMVNEKTFHKIFLAALVVAAKFLDDSFSQFGAIAFGGGIRPATLPELEINFLLCINFDLNATAQEVDSKIYEICGLSTNFGQA